MLSAKTATQEFLAFLNRWLGRGPPQLHVICGNNATHHHPRVRAGLGKHPRVQLHFTPTVERPNAPPPASAKLHFAACRLRRK